MHTSINDHKKLLLAFHHRACKRSLKELLRENLYILDGWAEADFKELTASPSYKPAEYKATFPAASGHLPFRHDWVMLTQGKFKTSEVADDFQTFMDDHDKKFNPSQQPYTGENAGVKRKAETPVEKPDGHEIPM